MGSDWIAFNKRIAENAAAVGRIPNTLRAMAAHRRLLAQEISICLHRGNARVIRQFRHRAKRRDIHAHRLQLRRDAARKPKPGHRRPAFSSWS